MSGWKECKLGDVAEIVGGGTPKTKESEYWNGEIAWLTPRDLSNFNGRYISRGERNISKLGLAKSSAKILPKGVVLLSSRAPVGYLAIAKNEISTNQGFRSLIPNFKTNSLFLFYLLKNNVEYLKSQSTGTTFGELAGSTLKSLSFLFPPLPEQKAIASVLSSLDDKIDLLHRQNKTLEAIAETLFRQWFVEEAQEGWEEGSVGDIADINPTYQLKKGEISTYVEMKNVSTTIFNPKGWYKRKFTSGMKFQNGDTLLARITPCLENGKTCFVTFLDEEEVGWGSTEYIVMRMKEPFHPYISYIIAKDKDFRDFAISSMSGSSGRQRAQANIIKEYDIKVPPLGIIEDLNRQIAGILPKLKNNAIQIRTLETFRDTLLPKLMSGEVRIECSGGSHAA